ncbi:MAG: GIY-YIG nuclease family protein [bacterium]|nr:GIY-YIG nuclease family protein [bacterium]
MYYVYALKSQKDLNLYIGFTTDLKERMERHKNGEVLSTKHRRLLKLIFYEAFINKHDALAREKYLKSGYGKEQLQSILKNILT